MCNQGIEMDISLTLPTFIAKWLEEQENQQDVIIEILKKHIDSLDTKLMKVGKLLKENVEKMPEGIEFEIQQVVGQELWGQLSRSERVIFGKEVKRCPEEYGLMFLHRNVSNHAVYKKLAK